MIEKHYSLRQAARVMGIDPETLKRWLTWDGLPLARVRRGSKLQIRQSDIDRLLEKRRDARAWGIGNTKKPECRTSRSRRD